MAGRPCPLCARIDSPLPGTPPLRLTLQTRADRTYLGCARRHEFEQADLLRDVNGAGPG